MNTRPRSRTKQNDVVVWVKGRSRDEINMPEPSRRKVEPARIHIADLVYKTFILCPRKGGGGRGLRGSTGRSRWCTRSWLMVRTFKERTLS